MKLKKENGKTIIVFENDEEAYPNAVDYYEPSIVSALDVTDFEVYDDNPRYVSIDGIVYTRDGLAIVAVPCGKSGCVKIREGVKTIKWAAFCKSAANKVVCPQSLRLIDKYAFKSTAYTDMEDVDTTSDNISDDVVNTNNAISEDVDALLDADYSDSSDEVIDNIDEYTGDDESIANMALNPKITSYKVTEIEAPLGHNNYGVTKSFSVTMPQDKDRVIEVQFSDDPKVLDSRMTIKKLSAKGNPISGTIFKVEYIDDFNGNSDNVKRTWYLQSDANGIVRFDDNHVVTSLTQYRSDEFFKFNNNIVLPYYGQLRFTEVSTPASYVLNSEPFVVNLADAQNGSTVDLSKTVYNDLEPAKVQLTKYKDDGSPLAGVEFELKFVKESETATNNKSESFSRLLNVGETTTATTAADGKITWENLDQGDYEIRETKTVDGCALLTDVIKITLPLQLTKDEADSYGNVNKDLAKEDTNYTKKWYFFDCKYEIKNNQVFLMPMTGSDGTWMYGFVGFAAIAFTGCLYLLLDEKKKNKRKHRRKRR